MTTSAIEYASPASITITPASLANGAYRQSDAVSNASDKYIGAIVGGKVRVGTVSADGQVEIYVYASYDGTNYKGVPGTTDATITWGTDTSALGYQDLKYADTATVDDTDDDDYVEFGPFDVAEVCGVMPIAWGIVYKNATGASFHATQTDSELNYIGVKYTSA